MLLLEQNWGILISSSFFFFNLEIEFNTENWLVKKISYKIMTTVMTTYSVPKMTLILEWTLWDYKKMTVLEQMH